MVKKSASKYPQCSFATIPTASQQLAQQSDRQKERANSEDAARYGC
jgi:hypothetical protein